MGKDEQCKLLCKTPAIPEEDAKFINERIADTYALNFVVDGLPAAHIAKDERTGDAYYNIGVRLGENDGTAALNNHYSINIEYHELPGNKKRVVGVLVGASSRNTQMKDGKPVCDPDTPVFHLKEDGSSEVVYTYSVSWTVSFLLLS